MPHIEKNGVVRTVYSGIFWAYWRILRHIQTYAGIIEAYEAIIRYIRNSAIPLHTLSCHIRNPGLFITWSIFKNVRMILEHVRWSCIFRVLSQSSLFKHFQGYLAIQGYWCISTHTNGRATTGERGDIPCPFWKLKKVTKSKERSWLCAYLGWIFHSKCSFKSTSEESCVFDEIFIEVPYFHKPSPPPCPKNFCLRTYTKAFFSLQNALPSMFDNVLNMFLSR